ncbi:MAG: discoidin domain-containing protein [Clostridium sp.]|nr:discoidin domain-containing protein [Clostridium sp.]
MGFVNRNESPQKIADGDESTKWCDVTGVPSTIDFDLGKPTSLVGWRMVNAAVEEFGYVTAEATLLGRKLEEEEWKPIDTLAANRRNIVKRIFDPTDPVRYVLLMVTQPTQHPSAKEPRIYELEIYE